MIVSETDEAEAYSITVAKALAMITIDLLLSKDLVVCAKETFKQQLEAEKLACQGLPK
jgi:hypothetical protein